MGTAVGTFSGRSNHRGRLETQMVGQNVAGNYSAVNFQFYAERTAGSSSYYQSNGGGGSINIAGQVIGIPAWQYDFRNTAAYLLASGTVNIGHNADGTQSYGFSFSVSAPGTLGSASGSSAEGLPTIPRSTTPSVSPRPVLAGSVLTVNLPRASTAFTHTIQAFYGSYSATIATGVATSFAWTVPPELSAQTPNSLEGGGTIRAITFNGGTQIGYVDTSFQVRVPDAVVPTFTDATYSEATAGLAANVGAYVQGISTLAVDITGEAGVQGSTIRSTTVTVAGQTVSAPGTSLPINASGSVAIVGTVTDSRGRVATKSYSINVLPYAPPAFTATVQRANAAGAPIDEGTYFRVNINATVQSLINSTQRNALTYRISSRLRGTTTWTVKRTTTPGGIAFNNYALINSFGIEDAWEVLVEVIDDFATTALQLTVATAAIFMHWDARDGVGIGKYRQQGMLDVAGAVYADDGKRVSTDVSRKGVVDANWLWGPVAVTLTDGLDTTTSVSATIGRSVEVQDVKPGAEVILTRFGTAWMIVAAAKRNKYARRVRLTLENGWASYNNASSNAYGLPHIWVDDKGIVGLEGLLRRPAGAPVTQSVIAYLPPGLMPPGSIVFGAHTDTGFGQLEITTSGELRYRGGGVAYFGLENARWRHPSIARIPLSLQNGWVNYDAVFAPPAFTIDSNGVVLIEGMVKSGTTAPITAITTFPASIQGPALNVHLPTVSSNAFSYFRVGGSTGGGAGRVLNIGAGANAAWFSIAGMFVDASSPLEWVAPYSLNGWVGYGPTHAQPGLTRTPEGLGIMRGLWGGGTAANFMGRLFYEALPDFLEAKLFYAVASDLIARFDVSNQVNATTVTHSSGGSVWTSTEACWRVGSTYTGPEQGVFSGI